MTTIVVPAPPKSAFNKDRPVSDLLRGQLKHFAHIEATLPAALRSGMAPREYSTENGAAKYIAHLTNALRGVNQAKSPTPISKVATPSQVLVLAAAADGAADATAAVSKSKTKAARNGAKRAGKKA